MSAGLPLPEAVPEAAASFITSEEAHKAAYDNGFRVELGGRGGWVGYSSTTARGEAWMARDPLRSLWLLAVTHAGVAAELSLPTIRVPDAPGRATYAFPKLAGLYAALDRVYKLGVSLPDGPLEAFSRRTAGLTGATDAERLTVVRIGQDVFRDALLEYWNGRCPLTGIADRALLRASHIVPWAECETDGLRLDVHNGLLLSALWDCAFDGGLVGFSDAGVALRSPGLGDAAARALGLDAAPAISGLTALHRQNLRLHRSRHGFPS